jgi:hypothetical protein
MNEGYTQIIKDGSLKIIDKNNNAIAIGKYNSNYGLIEMIKNENQSLLVTKSSLGDWYKRFAHFNIKSVVRNLRLKSIDVDDDID